ncbi:uncharacterized protein EDB91DRAFT_140959 [Suillus paluster]|uniref:uncharacterized protein n=1 Tax=Suillus paluster TaxID=48578 RepID=UPI001B874D2D|nr:uncharacterized protein EDB91DRAFT_140959 [Suillus paluster]KAG1724513.1 hypothetical protein EDB91DRAFT_140959 [Suillus paluster]
MTILADSDHRCQLRVLLSTSKKKPSKPGMILGEWLFSFGTLMEHSGSDNRLRLCMYHQRLASPCGGRTAVGNLSFTISSAPAFSTSEQGQILRQFPEPHPSNQSPEMFTAPQDLSWSKKGGSDSGKGSRGGSQRDSPSVLDLNPGNGSRGGSQRDLPSVLDFYLAFKEPDEYERPESPIRQTRTTAVFRGLKRKLRMYMLRARHPAIYARYINSPGQQEHSNVSFAVSTVIIVTDSDVDGSCLH